MESFLSPEEEAELGFIVRAVDDLYRKLDLDGRNASVLAALVEGLVRTALLRAKSDRRMAYLGEWRQFLCWLPDAISAAAEKDKTKMFQMALRQFRVRDRRGKRKPVPSIPEGTNCLLMRDEELWYAKVPREDLWSRVSDVPLKADLKVDFENGRQIYLDEVASSTVEIDRAEYLAPFYPPGVLKRAYNRLLLSLPQTDPISESEEEIVNSVHDVPAELLRKWLRDGVTRKDLALLIAARKAGLTAKVSNLPHLHTDLKWARL
ncbi:MAG: hypothetical protein WBQ72_07390 [Terriglobales bacterium]